jgi:WASH complex subunit strumpellin
MREIVDKHFYDNWVIPFYLGYIIDLTKEWENFKAAKVALGNTLELDTIENLTKGF